MLVLLINVVLFWVIMPVLIIGVGKMVMRYTAGVPGAGGRRNERRVSRFQMLRAPGRVP